MRLRLLRRRLTISAPRVAVRSTLPWPLRWVLFALVFGFCAAIGLWAFEFGRDIAGLDRQSTQEIVELREQVDRFRSELLDAQAVASTAGSQLTTERAAQASLVSKIRELEAENASLRDDLGFFERLLPVSGNDSLGIRGLQAEMVEPQKLRWQVLVIQSAKNAPPFTGSVELTLAGTLDGKPWQMGLPEGLQAVTVQQYKRLQGIAEIPPQAVVKTLTARLSSGNTTRSTQTIRM